LGIVAPIIMAMSFSFAAIVASFILWEENSPGANKKSEEEGICDALGELKKREVLTVAIMESIYQGILVIFIFAWTPILQNSTPGPINFGFSFTCFVICIMV
jgi:hypothetical protein